MSLNIQGDSDALVRMELTENRPERPVPIKTTSTINSYAYTLMFGACISRLGLL